MLPQINVTELKIKESEDFFVKLIQKEFPRVKLGKFYDVKSDQFKSVTNLAGACKICQLSEPKIRELLEMGEIKGFKFNSRSVRIWIHSLFEFQKQQQQQSFF